MASRTTGGEQTGEHELGSGVSDGNRSTARNGPHVAAVWLVAVGVLVVVASRQVHTGVVEDGAVAVVLLGATGGSLVMARRDQLVRAWPWIVVTVVVAVAVGLWNPWNLAAVGLILSHPFAAAIGLSMVGGVLLVGAPSRERPWPVRFGRATAGLALVIVVALSLLGSAANAGFAAPGGYTPYYRTGTEDGFRLDQHEVSEQGRCRAVVLRSGRGLTMRERVVANECFPSAQMAVTETAVEVCVVADYRTARFSRFDRETLALLDEAPATVVAGERGSPCADMADGADG